MTTGFSTLLRFGAPVTSDCKIKTFEAKTGAKPAPGDVVVLNEKAANTGIGIVEKATTANIKTNCVIGVAMQGCDGLTVPVCLDGQCVVNLDSSVFTGTLKVGECIHTTPPAGKCPCRCGIIRSEIKALDGKNASVKAYILAL